VLAAMVAGMALKPAMMNVVAPGGPTASLTDFSGVVLPADIGQSPMQVYVKQSKHTIRGFMLDYWRANGAAAVFGNPISEPFASPTGYYSQAFENGIFEYHPEYEGSNDPLMRLTPIGSSLIAYQTSTLRRDRRRMGGGGDPRSSIWMALDPDSEPARNARAEGAYYSETTGHTITGDFLDWYEGNQGAFYLGEPLSQAFREAGITMQYFECGVLTRVAGTMQLAPIGRRGAELLGVDLSPVSGDGLENYRESLFVRAGNPNPQGDESAPGKRWIEVDVSENRLWAYQGNEIIHTTLVSTGLPPNNTERGTFHIRLKFEKQTMSGFESGTGEVLSLGNNPVAGGSFWEVKDVPNVMYINTDAEALHGAYWHNNFGRPMSHGCINLPLDVAKWMYGWAPIGTMVKVHD
jgi:hypothetical protein